MKYSKLSHCLERKPAFRWINERALLFILLVYMISEIANMFVHAVGQISSSELSFSVKLLIWVSNFKRLMLRYYATFNFWKMWNMFEWNVLITSNS